MTSLQNIGTTHRTVAPPFTVYDSNRNSNPFRNELCVDGTNMYDEVAMDARMKGEGLILQKKVLNFIILKFNHIYEIFDEFKYF
jgi:hypothetical protein